MASSPILIRPTGDHPTIQWAAQELARYLRRVMGPEAAVSVQSAGQYAPTAQGSPAAGALWLGTGDTIPSAGVPAVEDPLFDDAISLDVQAGQGVIAGSNPRSVLLGVYRFLTEIGCRWVRPGADGEYIPRRGVEQLTAQVREKAAYRHRGICIEGAVSYENVAEIVDWAPKVGFNAYFTQFREAYTFFERWYAHRDNPLKQGEPFPVERARDYVAQAVREIKRRDLIYHAVGHGWTCEPLGVPGMSWDSQEYDLPESVTQYLAEVNGVRGIWEGIPLNTNLCYSNPTVRRLIVENIADYTQEHADIDVLHFWLADGTNNQCECEACRRMIPSDFYVQMLNELDEVLTQRGIATRIVFLIYVDLLWPPEVERIRHPERFILMFAPITRTYSRDFAVQNAQVSLAPYQRNRLQFPSNVDENVAFLRAWQGIFEGDSFDFDYHIMWDHYNDPGYTAIARLVNRDIALLREIGLNGFMSCQIQRAFFPTGLPMVVMGRTLWNDKLGYEEVAADYFRSAYGAEGGLCQEYLARLSELFDPPYLRGEEPAVSAAAAERFARIPEVVSAFRPVVERNLAAAGDECRAASWRYLQYHLEFCTRFAGVLEARARGEKERSLALWQALVRWGWENEDALQSVFDVYEFVATIGRKLV